jgi:hypothetical protein
VPAQDRLTKDDLATLAATLGVFDSRCETLPPGAGRFAAHDVACDVVRSSMPVEESLAVCDAAIAESDCVAGHIGLEPANPSADYPIEFARQLRLSSAQAGCGDFPDYMYEPLHEPIP